MDEFKEPSSKDNKGPMPPSMRSERIGPKDSGVKSPIPKKGLARFFTWKWFVLVLSTSVLLSVGGCLAIMLSAQAYDLNDLNRIDLSTRIYAEDPSVLVGKVGSENRECLTYDEITKFNPDLPMAFVKVEDERFFDHHGIDYRGFLRALFTNVREGKNEQGASTITMQVAGNLILQNREKTYTRKLKEVMVALNLERKATKKKLLEVYMNLIYFGNGVYGVKAASAVLFGKDITKEALDPQEIALLAGLPKAPNGYNPYGTSKQKDKALERRNVVLMLMAQKNSTPPLITEEQKRRYQETPLGVDPKFKKEYLKNRQFDAYKDFVQKEAQERYGLSYSDLGNGGYQIYTSMDPQAQSGVDRVMKDDALFHHKKGLNGAVTLMNSRTGEVVAIGGGRAYSPGSYNWSRMDIPLGSGMKPLVTYAPAVEDLGYTQYTSVADTPFNYRGWRPNNYNKGKFHGDVSLKFALAHSLNAATARLLVEKVTVPRAYQYAKELGLPLLPSDEVPAALALGGLTKGVSTVDVAQAYSVFPNGGAWTTAHSILKIVDSSGVEVRPLAGKEIREDGNAKRVFSPKTAWYMTGMMQAVVTEGTGKRARLEGGRQVAGKSGTTQNDENGWFIGYTPNDIVGAVVVFNEPGSREKVAGGSLPAKIFSLVMSDALRGKPFKYFQRPRGVEDAKPPFQLKAPELQGSFDPKTSSIHLSWPKQDDRVSFEILRSEDQNSWISLGQQPLGSTGYTDTSIAVVPPVAGTPPQNYYYRVIATDTLVGERKASVVITVAVTQVVPGSAPPVGGGAPLPPSAGSGKSP